MFKKLLLSLIVVVPVIAQAEWVEITRTNEKKYYLNNTYIKDNSDIVQYWVKSIIYNDLTKDGQSVGDYSMQNFSGKCNSRETAFFAFTDYYNDGRVLRSDSRSYASYSVAVPESVGEFLLLAACAVVEVRRNQ